MSTENWAEERDRLRALLSALESGDVTHLDKDDGDVVKPATIDERIARTRQRLAALEDRLGSDDQA